MQCAHQSSFTIASPDESSSPAAKLSDLQEHNNGQAVSTGIIAVHPPAGNRDCANRQELEDTDDIQDLDPNRGRSPPPRYPYPASEASGSTSLSIPHTRPAPPPFFDLYEYASAEDLADEHFESLPPTEKSPALQLPIRLPLRHPHTLLALPVLLNPRAPLHPLLKLQPPTKT
ncbi:hypothetical protein PG997_005987 [Apiospora hydei]|uniref:Uncharacterized protein n=1 Tax=Apiospora hydei TaxID=1337664 RepID=A0ABR1WMF1_9PEZI